MENVYRVTEIRGCLGRPDQMISDLPTPILYNPINIKVIPVTIVDIICVT